MTDFRRNKPIGTIFENIVKEDLINELQTVSKQQNKEMAEKKENRMKAIKDEVKQLHSMAAHFDKKLEQELNNLNPITNVQAEHGVSCAEIIRRAGNLQNKYGEWMASHEQRFKNMQRIVDDMNLTVEQEQPDENCKFLNNLLVIAESKHLLTDGKRETIGLVDGDLDVIRREIRNAEEEYSQLSE